MIEFRTGDILRADVEALVNTVNCVGIMGRGIALQFRNAFPENFKAYVIGGASGGGGSNFTGSYSGTLGFPVCPSHG